MFEEVGDARNATGFVGGADAIPDHVGYDGGAVIGNDHDLHPVRQVKFGYAGLGCGRLSRKILNEHRCTQGCEGKGGGK